MGNKRPTTPGPGDYLTQRNKGFGTGGPKFSMGNSVNDDPIKFTNLNLTKTQYLQTVSNPGPGQYNLTAENLSPSYKFGEGTKDINYDNKLPGPGSYRPMTTTNSAPQWR